MASYVADHIRVICPSGLHSQHKFIPDEFVFACPKKSNQKKRHPNQFAPSGFPQHSPLPTGRPDSPSGLDMTKSGVLPAISYLYGPIKGECFGKLRGEVLLPVKLAEDSFTGRVD